METKKQNLKFVIKQAVKEAVREVLREEMKSLLEEIQTKNTLSGAQKLPAPSDFYISEKETDSTSSNKNYISEIFNQVRESISPEEAKRFSGHTSTVHFDNPVKTAPQVGVSIDNLDFVKRASTVYNLANQKSKGKA